jgi:copper chaperone CopZ
MHATSPRLLLAGLAFAALTGSASATEIALDVRGLVCAFCAKGIDASAKRHPAVAGVAVDLDNALVRFDLKSDAKLDPEGAKKILTEAGFDVKGAIITPQSTTANLARLAQVAGRALPSTASSAYLVESVGPSGGTRLHARLTVDRKSAAQWIALTSPAGGDAFAPAPANLPLGWAPGTAAPRQANPLFAGRPALLALAQPDDHTSVLYIQVDA